MGEKDRMESTYRDYSASGHTRRWSGPGNDYLLHTKWGVIEECLRRAGFKADGALVLDLGSSAGASIPRLTSLGCSPRSIACIDIRHETLRDGRSMHPHTLFVQSDALHLPFPNERFDMVHQSVMMSSALDERRRYAMAREMVRVTKRQGLVLWYDLRYPSPFNPNFRPIGRREIQRYFSDCQSRILSTTLIPHLSRALAPISWRACRLLERIPLLRSHLLAVIKRD